MVVHLEHLDAHRRVPDAHRPGAGCPALPLAAVVGLLWRGRGDALLRQDGLMPVPKDAALPHHRAAHQERPRIPGQDPALSMAVGL